MSEPREPEDDDDHTVVVERDAPAAPQPEDEDHTVVVEREAPVASAPAAEEDHTVVVVREAPAAPAEEHTVAVPLDEQGSPIPPAPSDTSLAHDSGSLSPMGPKLSRTGTRRRGELRPAPVPEGFGRTAVQAIGVGAIMSYTPTEVVAETAVARPVEQAAEATRFRAPSMPSIERRSRSSARVALGVLGAACLVSLGGLAGLIVFLVTSR